MSFEIFYNKPKNSNFLETLEKFVDRPQNYIPIYKLFFDLNEINYNKISLNQKYYIKSATKEIEDNECYMNATLSTADGGSTKQKNVFIKYSPVLDPVKYMIGKYDIFDERIKTLPRYNSTEEECLPKILDTNNSSYIDGFFTYLTSQLLHNCGFIHGIDYYGSYMGIQHNYKINVVEDLDYLQNSKFFRQNIGKLFNIENIDHAEFFGGAAAAGDDDIMHNSRNCKIRLEVIDSDPEIEFDTLPDINPATAATDTAPATEEPPSAAEIESIYEKSTSPGDHSDSDSDNSSLNYTSDGDNNSTEDISSSGENASSDDGSSAADDETIESYSDSSEDEDIIVATIYNFPVHMICLEKCEGTLDNLMESGELSDEKWRSALIQVIMTLIVLQKAFYLTHNDLHTNNIMFVETKHKYIYYKIEDQYFCVPTYGKIFKIIDYGRAIYTYRGQVFCSDSFDFHADAAGQYNFPPYYNDRKPIIEPNYSFDLCRLGCSMYDFFIEDGDDIENLSPLKKLIYEWCCDDNGKNVLYKSSGEERYPDFKLYKMIARSVHKHTPLSQLSRPFFRKYLCEGGVPNIGKNILIDIDTMPNFTGGVGSP